MFGFVTANMEELSRDQQQRYQAVYCGICRGIREHSGQLARLTLRYDMAFLALLLLSLYEPEEVGGRGRCAAHPIVSRPWTDHEIIRYCADMNVALAYWQCMDDWQDDGSKRARWMASRLEDPCRRIAEDYSRQWNAIQTCLGQLAALERENCAGVDEAAACFGRLMEELLVLREDHWSGLLRKLGNALGRFVYLMDAAVDLEKDRKTGSYNPWLAALETTPEYREEALVTIMGRCAEYYEALPLVQDKALLDNILYSGVWVNYRNKRKEGSHGGSV